MGAPLQDGCCSAGKAGETNAAPNQPAMALSLSGATEIVKENGGSEVELNAQKRIAVRLPG
jgi:hypothetical protein